MKYIKQFAIIITVSFIGEILNRIIPLPVPASIWGLMLMLALLILKIVPLGAVRETAKFLVSLMQIMFIPAAVGLLTSLEALRSWWPAILLSIVVVTPVVFFTSGKVTDLLIARSKKAGSARTHPAAYRLQNHCLAQQSGGAKFTRVSYRAKKKTADKETEVNGNV